MFSDVFGCYALADRGYDSDVLRAFLRSQNCEPVIPGRCNRKQAIAYNKPLYRKRGLIERLFGKIKENKRLAARFEKSDAVFMAFIAVALSKVII